MLNIAIVFPVFNGLGYTKDCLESLYNTHKISTINANIFTVIVDDASTDGSYEWIHKNYPQVNLLKGDGNLWWSGGINMAVRYAIDKLNADYILWWNNDIIAEKTYFENLIQILNNNDTKIIIGSKIYLYQNKKIIWSMGGMFNPYTGEKSMIGTEQYDGDNFRQIVECDWLTGMGTITHKSVYNIIGMLDEKNFPQYYGDSDFIYRAKLNGYTIIVNPKLKIYNDTRSSGLKHDESFKKLIKSLFTVKSSFNIKKEYKFYKRYSKSYRAYLVLLYKYFKYVGGFFKWKILGLIGIKRK